MFSCDFCEIFKNIFFTEHLRPDDCFYMQPVLASRIVIRMMRNERKKGRCNQNYHIIRSSHLEVFYKRFTKFFTPVPESFLIKLQAVDLQLCQKETPAQGFPVNFVNFLRTPIFQNIYAQLFLYNKGKRRCPNDCNRSSHRG